jgi:hypothetical protein
MKKIPIKTGVQVDGSADQWPFERIVDTGIVLDNSNSPRYGYLVQLLEHCENLIFRRRDLTPITPAQSRP